MAKKARQRRQFGAVRKLPSGRYQASYIATEDGTRHLAPHTFETSDDADAWLSIRRSEIVRGEWARPARRDGITLTVFANAWVAKLDRAPGTVYTYRTTLDREILPTFGHRQIAKITEREVRDWFDAIPADKPAKRAQAYRVLRSVMNAAVESGEIEKTPVNIRGASTAKVQREAEPLTMDELHALAAAMPSRMGIAVYVGAFAALRAGEVLGLQRRDVDLERRVLHIRRSAGAGRPGTERVGRTKTDSSVRDVAIPTFLADGLAVHLAASVGPDRDAFIFESPAKPGSPISYPSYHAHMMEAAKEIGRPEVRTHDLRHNGAVMAARSGATVRELMARLGHTSPEIAMRYQHATAERDRAIADRLGEALG